MSIFGDYIAERMGHSIIETDVGFITYCEKGDQIFIEELYVMPKARKNHYATELADKVTWLAKEKGYQSLGCAVWLNALNADDSLKVILAYGFKLDFLNEDMIYLKKEI